LIELAPATMQLPGNFLGVRWLATAFKAAASCRTSRASPPTKSMRH